MTITISPPLPCGVTLTIGRQCNQPATVASVHPMSNGQFAVLPMCRSCVEATRERYELPKENAK